MTTTPTERRLTITPGEAKPFEGSFSHGVSVHRPNQVSVTALCSDPIILQGENAANATLYADAHNTYNTCGLTPSELLAKVMEQEDQIENMKLELEGQRAIIKHHEG